MKILSHFSAIANRVIDVIRENFFPKIVSIILCQKSFMEIIFLVFSQLCLKYFVKGKIISESGEMAD